MRSKIYTVALIVIAVIVVFAFIGWFVLKPSPYIMQGEVEATSYKVSSKVPGRVDSLVAKRGEVVRKGDFLYRISSPEVYAKLEQAEAARTAAAAVQSKVDKGARDQQKQQAYEAWQAAESQADLAQRTYERVRNLYRDGVVPLQKLDEAEALMKTAQNNATALRAGYDMAVEGAEREDKQAAAAVVAQAGGAVSEVESYVSDINQYAPVDGEISSVISENGELVGTGYPVVTVVDLSDVWVVFNVKETMLPKLKIGTKITGYFPALDKSYPLTITYMAAEASYATWAATRTSGEFDIKTFEIHARPESNIQDIRPGMTVTVDYDSI